MLADVMHEALYAVPLMLGAAFLLAVAVLAWGRRGAPGATALIVLALLGATWPFGYAWELLSADYGTKILWAKVQYLGIATGPTVWLALTVAYTGRGWWLTRRRLALLAVEPVVVLILVWTNETHGLVWSSIAEQNVGALKVLAFSHGLVFWIHATYGYVLAFSGTTLLAQDFFHAARLHWRRSAVLVAGAAVPWGAILAFGFGLKLQGNIDPVPFVLPFSALVLLWGVTRLGLLDGRPRATRALLLQSTGALGPWASRGRWNGLEPLSDRERVVLRLVALGLSNIEIADQLGVTLNTAKSHVGAILRKLDSPNRTSAVSRGRTLQLIP